MKIIKYMSSQGPALGMYEDENDVYAAVGNIEAGYSKGNPIGKLADLTLMAPFFGSKIVAIGMNYLKHVKELDATREVPDAPVMFMKPPSSVIGPGEPIRLALPENDIHYEAELCIVMGKTATDVEEAEALDYVFGYTCGNDVSDRNIQFARGQWIQGKGYDSYCPLGPCIETDLDASNVRVQSRLNGEVRQNDNTNGLIFGIPYLISEVSKVMTLFPGDVIMTGTPHGVGGLKAGDTIEVEVEGIGVLRNPVVNR